MMLEADTFAPLTEVETAETPKAKRTKAEKVPILPVPADAPPCTFKIPSLGGAPVAMWAYRDREGRLLGYDARFEYEQDGERQKDVLPVTYCDEDGKRAWRSKAMPAPRALYGLDRLAARSQAPVLIVEGAKSADAAGELLPAYVAMSWSGGSKAINQSDWSTLRGRDVLIWPDRDRQCELSGEEKPYSDQPGTIAAENIESRLRNLVRSLRVLDLADYECVGGWDAADALAEGMTPDEATAFVRERAVEIDLAAPGCVMPFGFEYGADGLYHLEGDRRARIAGRIKLLAKTRDQAGSSWGLLLEWRDHDGRSHRWAMPMSMLAGDGSAIREAFLESGLFVPSDPKARGKLMEFLGTVDTRYRARAVTKVGWSGGAFALPELTIGDTPEDRVIFQQADGASHKYQSAGALEDWQEHVGRLAVGNSRLVFAISTAFVGPTLLPACEDGGGVNIVGSSSTGKTTALRAAASVWGPKDFVRNWRATSNGLEGVATQHNETFLALDELSQIEPREAGPAAYMLSNGQGKSRASRSGIGRAAATWNVMYLSTGEVGLAGIMSEAIRGRGPMAGQEVRILDVPADAGKGMGAFEHLHGAASPDAFARQITAAAAQHYGVASIAFITALAGIREQVGDMIAATISGFIAEFVEPGSDGQVVRAARRFGLIAAAGEMAQALGILPWPRREAIGAAGVMFRAWLDRRGGKGAAEERNIIAQVRGFLEAHGESRFSSVDVRDDEHHRAVINRAGFWKSVLGKEGEYEQEFFILPTIFTTEVARGFELATVIKALKAAGALKPGANAKSQQVKRLPGLGTKKVYVIGSEIFDGGE